MTVRRILGRVAALCSVFGERLSYRWRRAASYVTASRCAQASGRVFFGPDCQVAGHRHIHFRGDFTALRRNRIEAIARHGGRTYAPRLVFGRHVTMENDCHIGAVNHVEIGDDVLIASRVYISDHAHGGTTAGDLALRPHDRPVVSKGPVIIEPEVWLGEGVVVLPGVRIGRSAIIGANSVVTRDIPPRCVAAGAPARVVRQVDLASSGEA